MPLNTAPQSNHAQAATVLVVDDEPEMCELVETMLRRRGYDVRSSGTAEEALRLLESTDFAVLVVDIHLGGDSGIELCRTALATRPDLPVVVMTGFGTVEHAVAALRAGAYDFVSKPLSTDAFVHVVERALRHRGMTNELRRLQSRPPVERLAGVIGDGMLSVANMVRRIAATETSVLVTGESGTGKELVARALHELSGRSGPFLALNCAALPAALLEGELFGHVKGAFTDANDNRRGLFVEAHEGTLFLDEIGEMPLAMQGKLLRALQERKVRPLGGTQEVPFDARLIAATNRDLETEVVAKRFREDLFYRIHVVRVDVPALRHRGSDILELAQFFLNRAASRTEKPASHLDRTVAERLLAYEWPGNVRELENCMERALALALYNRITLDDLPPKVRDHVNPELQGIAGSSPEKLVSMDVIEASYIRQVLQAVNNNKTLAAKVLGFDRRTLYRKLTLIDGQARARTQPAHSA